uniref:Uncharacterized protein n=1 Tax=Caenorhabditis japonica TaxID=281687 RepID=A0A8R1ETJ7_CAEJA
MTPTSNRFVLKTLIVIAVMSFGLILGITSKFDRFQQDVAVFENEKEKEAELIKLVNQTRPVNQTVTMDETNGEWF